MILAGDVGGTKTLLGLFEPREDTSGQQGAPRLRCHAQARYASADHESLERIIGRFREQTANAEWDESTLSGACFGIAGPVFDQQVEATNLPWDTVAADSLSECLGRRPVLLINDLAAMGFGMVHLEEDRLVTLNEGLRRGGNAAVIAPGTGLGEAMVYRDREVSSCPIASEGGHADFAPQTERQLRLLRYLQLRDPAESEHVSWERVLSGDGLARLYSFVRDSELVAEPPWLCEELARGDRSEAISRIGLEGRHPLCTAAVEMFAELLGAEAGNLALRCLATGGVFLGGSMAAAIVPSERDRFLRGFQSKGRMRGLLRTVPVHVATGDDVPLQGAAYYFLGRRG